MCHNIDVVDIGMDINMAFIESVTNMYSLLKYIRYLALVSGQVSIFLNT